MANFYGSSGLDILQGLNSEANYYYFDAGEFNSTDIVAGGTGLSDILWFNDTVNLSTSTFLLKTGIESIHLSGLGNTVRLGDWIVASSNHTTDLFWVEGGFGDDELDASDVQSAGVYMNGSRGADTLTGGEGDDDLEGGVDNDEFIGSLGDDTYGDSSGVDSVTGTASELDGDTFNQIEWIILTSSGTIDITSFGIGSILLATGANVLTIDAVHSAQMVVYGNGGADEITLNYDGAVGTSTLYGSGGNDTIFGSGSRDSLSGGADVDMLTGSDGDDTLDGGSSGDLLAGGDGDDLYENVEAGDLVVELFTDGDDTVETALGAATLAAGVETMLYTAAGDFKGVGNSSSNVIDSGDGDDTLKGDAGNDTLRGHDGLDSIQGGDGADQLDGGDGADTLRGLDDDDELKAGKGEDSLYGGDGHDTLKANTGADKLYGEEGDDFLEGGDGADSLYGGLGDDTASYASAERGIDADLNRASGQVITQAGTDELRGIENILGTFVDDVIVGNDDANVLDGLAGDDTIWGLGGDDTIEVASIGAEVRPGEGNDSVDGILGGTVRYDELDGGILAGFIAPFTISVTGAEAGDDTISMSNRIVGSLGDDSLYYFSEADGVDGDDWFAVGQGANDYDGGAGIDTLYFGEDSTGASLLVDLEDPTQSTGLAREDDYAGFEVFVSEDGADFFRGSSADEYFMTGGNFDIVEAGGGNDTIAGGEYFDVFDGGEGTDYADYSTSAAVQIDMATGLHDGGEAYADAFTSIEGVLGSAFDDTMLGDSLANIFLGAGGDDTLEGEGGQDTLTGGEGADLLVGGSGADRFILQSIADTGNDLDRDTIDATYEVGEDLIDLSAIDAIGGGGDDAFSFIGDAEFSGVAGELRYAEAGGATIVRGDVDGDGNSDFKIEIALDVALAAADFVL